MNGNIYYMDDMGTVNGFYKMVLSKTKFRTVKKGGFYSTKKSFKVNKLDSKNDLVLKDDGSLLVPNNYNKTLFKRLGRFYPIY